jgi:hypothetical protein
VLDNVSGVTVDGSGNTNGARNMDAGTTDENRLKDKSGR